MFNINIESMCMFFLLVKTVSIRVTDQITSVSQLTCKIIRSKDCIHTAWHSIVVIIDHTFSQGYFTYSYPETEDMSSF